jgi:hypothetical protein
LRPRGTFDGVPPWLREDVREMIEEAVGFAGNFAAELRVVVKGFVNLT